MSFLLAAFRWLNVSFEATYRNDIADHPGARLIRVARPVENPRTAFEHRLNVLRTQTAAMGLFGFNMEKAGSAVANGVLSAAVAFDQIEPGSSSAEADAEDLLRDVGKRIGFEKALLQAWEATAKSVYFALQQSPRAMSHHGLPEGGSAPTIDGYRKAYDVGYRCMQVDVMRSNDGRLIVAHSVFGRSLPFAQPPLDAPTLRSVIDGVGQADVYWNIETKSKETLPELVNFLREEASLNRLHHYCVSSPMRSGLLRSLRLSFPVLATNDSLVEGALIGRPISLRSRSRNATASGCQLWYWQVRLWPSLRSAQKRGRNVQVWGVNTEKRANWLAERGVPTVICNGSTLAEWPNSLGASEA